MAVACCQKSRTGEVVTLSSRHPQVFHNVKVQEYTFPSYSLIHIILFLGASVTARAHSGHLPIRGVRSLEADMREHSWAVSTAELGHVGPRDGRLDCSRGACWADGGCQYASNTKHTFTFKINGTEATSLQGLIKRCIACCRGILSSFIH